MTETLSHVDEKLRIIGSTIVNGINNRFNELVQSNGFVPQEQAQNKLFDMSNF